ISRIVLGLILERDLPSRKFLNAFSTVLLLIPVRRTLYRRVSFSAATARFSASSTLSCRLDMMSFCFFIFMSSPLFRSLSCNSAMITFCFLIFAFFFLTTRSISGPRSITNLDALRGREEDLTILLIFIVTATLLSYRKRRQPYRSSHGEYYS